VILLSFILRQFLTIASGLDFLVHSLTLRTDLYSSFLSGVTLTGGVETILAHPLLSNFHFHLYFLVRITDSQGPWIFLSNLCHDSPKEFYRTWRCRLSLFITLPPDEYPRISRFLALTSSIDLQPILLNHSDRSFSKLDRVGSIK